MMSPIRKLLRRWQILALDRVDASALAALAERRLVRQFQRVARRVPAYATLLRERGVVAERLKSPADILRHCPTLQKDDLFGRFPLRDLCVDGNLTPAASVLTSSGHGSRFAFGLSNARQADAAARATELGLEYAFGTDRHRTLLINALPMGVRFSCSTVTIAETSVREDMVAALAHQVAPDFAQTILVLDPLFAKRLLDHSRESGLDWSGLKVHVILGEETFGEHFRSYVARRLGQDPVSWHRGFVGSSMGIGELGLNLFFETRETVRLRQLAHRRPDLLSTAIGPWPGKTPPLIFVYDPRRLFVEIHEPDSSGFGALTLSTLDPTLVLPLLRYGTGDRARLLNRSAIESALTEAGETERRLPALPMIAMAGREKDQLRDGRTLLDFKDALYADPDLADHLTGAIRIEHDGAGYRIHLQLRQGWQGAENEIAGRVARVLPPGTKEPPDRIEAWRYSDFPFGMTLDYERKFSYYSNAPTAP